MPIFIVGFPRSGTTLAQKLVSQHLGIPTLPETHFFEYLDAFEPAGGQLAPAAAKSLVERLGAVLEIEPRGLPALSGRESVPIRALFLQLIGQQIGSQALADKGVWIEKTPGHAEHLERIHAMFPKARFLCMVRNPVNAFASRRELFETGQGWGEEWKPIEVYCSEWAGYVTAMRAFAERHPGQAMLMRLEDLAADADAQLAHVREFLGPGFAKPVDAPLQPGIVQPFETWKRDALKPVDPAIAGREGRGLLDAYESWRVKTLLHAEMSSLGYDTDVVEPAPLDDLHRKLIASVNWYRQHFARRDALMDVKTTRIRALMNELAGRAPAAAPAQAAGEPADPGAKKKGAGKKPAAEAASGPAKAPRARPVDDDDPPPPRPITLRGISGMTDQAPVPAPAPVAAKAGAAKTGAR